MAPKESSKTLTLSAKYVVDSSDDQDASYSDRPENSGPQIAPESPAKQRSTAKAREYQKRKTLSPASESSSGSLSGEEDEDEGELEVADLLDGSVKQASSKPSVGQERSRKKLKSKSVFDLRVVIRLTNVYRSVTERSIPPKPFSPPSGFVRRTSVDEDYTSHTYQFLNDELKGKQVWHITAPVHVSLDSIKTFGVHAARKSETVLKADGKSYRFAEEKSQSKYLLVPGEGQGKYVTGKPAISRTFDLREIINPPAKSKDTEADQSKPMFFEFQPDDELPVRPKREQPKGLRMRYKPFGTTATSPEGSDSEQSEIYIPDQLPTSPKNHHQKKSKKSHGHRKSVAALEDNDAMDVEWSRSLSSSEMTSPQSTKHSQSSPLMHAVHEKEYIGQEKTKKKSKKHKDRAVSSN